MAADFTLIDEGRVTRVDAQVVDGRVLVADADVARATGWERKPQGMCRDDMCVPLRDDGGHTADRVDLAAFAALLRRPLAVDVEERAACLGTAAEDRGAQLGSLRAPDFALPDLDGRVHSLRQHRGRKVLLVVYASW